MPRWQRVWKSESWECAALWHSCSLGSCISKTRQLRVGVCKKNATPFFRKKDLRLQNKPIHCCQVLSRPVRLHGGCTQVSTISSWKVLVSSCAHKEGKKGITCRGSCSWLKPLFCIWKDLYIRLYQENMGWKLVEKNMLRPGLVNLVLICEQKKWLEATIPAKVAGHDTTDTVVHFLHQQNQEAVVLEGFGVEWQEPRQGLRWRVAAVLSQQPHTYH